MLIYSSIALFLFVFIVCTIIFLILKRPCLIDLVLGCVCAMLPSDWFLEVSGIVISPVYDLAFLVAVPIFTLSILQHKHYRNLSVFILLSLFTGYQVWSLSARFVQAGGLALQPVWSFYRNDLFSVVFLLAGIVLAWRPLRVQRCMLAILIGAFLLEAVIGIVQTASGGQLLTSFQNNLYLGFLTPLPVAMGLPVGLTELLLIGGNDNGIFVGSIFRAVGTHRQANWFAVSMIGGIALCIGTMVARQQPPWLRRWAIGGGGAMFIALVLSFTRTGYVAFAAMIACYFLFWQNLHQRLQMATIAFVFTLIAVSVLVIGGLSFHTMNSPLGETVVARIQQVRQPLKALQQENFRLKLWQIAFTRVNDSPWFGTNEPIKLEEVIPYFNIDLDVPLHNQLVTSIYNGGYVLGGFYLLIHFWLLWKSGQLKFYKNYDSMIATWSVAANLCFVGLAVESIGINWLAGASLPGLFWLLAGIVVMQDRVVYAQNLSSVSVAANPQALHSVPGVGGIV